MNVTATDEMALRDEILMPAVTINRSFSLFRLCRFAFRAALVIPFVMAIRLLAPAGQVQYRFGLLRDKLLDPKPTAGIIFFASASRPFGVALCISSAAMVDKGPVGFERIADNRQGLYVSRGADRQSTAAIMRSRQSNPSDPIPNQDDTMPRPSFNAAWAASQRIYDPVNSGVKVARVIGGNVEKNINNPIAAQRWDNTCAVRMSYILSQAGMLIPGIQGKTVSGEDGRKYFFRVRDLIAFLKQRWGKAEVVQYPVSGGGTLAGKKGVILFEVSGWTDAQGHATLFDGRSCYDHCYFNEPEAKYRTDRANFWSLR